MNVCGSAACTWIGGPTSSARRLLPWCHATSRETGVAGPCVKSTVGASGPGTSAARLEADAAGVPVRVRRARHDGGSVVLHGSRAEHAELVALGVGEDDPGRRAVLTDVGAGGAERHQPIDLGILVVGAEVEVQPVLS